VHLVVQKYGICIYNFQNKTTFSAGVLKLNQPWLVALSK